MSALRQAGFTLIELLVALAIVAVIGVIGLTGLSSVMDQSERIGLQAERWREVQLAMRLIQQDLSQLQPRPTRDLLGENWIPTLLANEQAEFALEFSRGGWSNPSGFARGNVGRVAYNWEDGTLVRYHWPVLDRTQGTEPVRSEILTQVLSIEILFLDTNGEWIVEWPASGIGGGTEQLYSRPRAMEILIELEDYGTIRRIVETTG